MYPIICLLRKEMEGAEYEKDEKDCSKATRRSGDVVSIRQVGKYARFQRVP